MTENANVNENVNDELFDPNLGMSRRTLLRRGAVVGGTLLWAAPTVQSLVRPAFAQTTGSPSPGGHAISYVAVVVRCTDGSTFRAKANVGSSGEETWEGDPGPPWQEPETGCYPTGYSSATKIDGGLEGLSLVINTADLSQGTLTVPSTLAVKGKTVANVSASAFGGQSCQQFGLTAPYISCAGGCVLAFDL